MYYQDSFEFTSWQVYL